MTKEERLISALIGLVRAAEGNEDLITAETDRMIIDSLATLHESALDERVFEYLMKEVKVDSAESSSNAETKLKEEGDAKKTVSRRKTEGTEEDIEKSTSGQKALHEKNEEKKSSANKKDKSVQEESEKSRSK